MIIDIHTHVYDKPDYISMLAETAQNLGFNKLCIGGGEARYGLASNEDVIEKAEAYPELFIPFGYIKPGLCSVSEVEKLQIDGFKGLKIGAPPTSSYDCADFFSVLLAASTLGLPVLFHTRIFPPTPLDKAEDVRSDMARPIYLDRLARRIPDLKIIGTGLGAPWFEEAAALLKMHGNIFFDLSGIQLRERGGNFFKLLLGAETGSKWNDAPENTSWKQIVFGTATENKNIPFVERDYQRLFRSLALPESVVGEVMGGNAARLLNNRPA